MKRKIAHTTMTYIRQFPATMSDEQIKQLCWYISVGKYEDEIRRGVLTIERSEVMELDSEDTDPPYDEEEEKREH